MTLQLINPDDLPTPSTYTTSSSRPEPGWCSSPARNPKTFTATSSARHRPEHLPVIERARQHLFGEHKPADTVVGVETLAGPGYLIEVDAIAVTDR